MPLIKRSKGRFCVAIIKKCQLFTFAPDQVVKRSILCNNNQKTQLFTKPTYNQAPPPPQEVKRSILCNNNQKTQLFTKPTYNQAPPPHIR